MPDEGLPGRLVLQGQVRATHDHITHFRALPDQPLLLSMEQAGIAWPSSCRNGTCRTCIGHIHTGAVRYHIDWPGLSQDEKTSNHLLPCVAYPLTDVSLTAGQKT